MSETVLGEEVIDQEVHEAVCRLTDDIFDYDLPDVLKLLYDAGRLETRDSTLFGRVSFENQRPLLSYTATNAPGLTALRQELLRVSFTGGVNDGGIVFPKSRATARSYAIKRVLEGDDKPVGREYSYEIKGCTPRSREVVQLAHGVASRNNATTFETLQRVRALLSQVLKGVREAILVPTAPLPKVTPHISPDEQMKLLVGEEVLSAVVTKTPDHLCDLITNGYYATTYPNIRLMQSERHGPYSIGFPGLDARASLTVEGNRNLSVHCNNAVLRSHNQFVTDLRYSLDVMRNGWAVEGIGVDLYTRDERAELVPLDSLSFVRGENIDQDRMVQLYCYWHLLRQGVMAAQKTSRE